MISRYRVSLNGSHLDQVSDSLFILDIQTPEPQITYNVASLGSKDGGMITRKYRNKASVAVSFYINEYDIAKRNEVLRKVVEWGKQGGVLQINERPEQVLRHAFMEKIPAMSAKNWTEPLSIEIADYVFPYWEDDIDTVASLTQGTDKTGTILLKGNADKAYLCAEITAKASVSWIKVYSGDTMIYLTDLSLSNGDIVKIDYDDYMNLRIKQGTTSLLTKRSADSNDDLIANCGSTTSIRVQASGNVTSVFRGRGCWL